MSAKRADEWVDDRDPMADDPYGIVPDDFMSDYPAASTIGEALRLAELAAADTDPRDAERCPECESIRITTKSKHVEMEHKRSEAMKCESCGAHFDEPLESREAAAPGEQATLSEVSE